MFYFPRNIPIRRKLTLVVLVSSTAALLVASAALFAFQVYTFRQNFMRDLVSLAEIISSNSTAAITFGDADAAHEILTGLRVKQQIEDAFIALPNGKVLARFGGNKTAFSLADYPTHTGFKFSGGDLLQTQEIRMDNEKIGTLYLRSDYGQMYGDLLHLYLFALAAVLALSSGIAFAISSQLQRVISAPIQKLAETARVIAEKNDYSLRAEKMEADEIGGFTDTFNHMLEEIQRQDTTLQSVQNTLERQVKELQHEIAERKRAEEEVKALHHQLVEASRHAGMAEVATGVLHNVGNVLNSVNVSASIINDRLRKSGVADLKNATELLNRHLDDPGAFVSSDPRGKHLPQFLSQLSQKMSSDEQLILSEIKSLSGDIDHIKGIVALQQSYTGVSGITDRLSIADLLDDAIRINSQSVTRHDIDVIREYEILPPVVTEKQKVLQILVNLLSNAKYAVIAADRATRQITVRTQRVAADRVRIDVVDNGVGIPRENLTRIFSHGFTTRKDGHGFGLHSAANLARELGGSLTVQSAGTGQGATFRLELPINSLEAQTRGTRPPEPSETSTSGSA
jgi:signal transduction histidine kinase